MAASRRCWMAAAVSKTGEPENRTSVSLNTCASTTEGDETQVYALATVQVQLKPTVQMEPLNIEGPEGVSKGRISRKQAESVAYMRTESKPHKQAHTGHVIVKK